MKPEKFSITYSRNSTVQIGEMSFDKVGFVATEEFGGGDIEKAKAALVLAVDKWQEEACAKIKQQIIIDHLDNKVRWYEEGGKKYVSVTSIISFINGFPDYPAGYAERGTIAHKYLEDFLGGKELPKWDIKSLVSAYPELVPELKLCQDKGVDIMDLQMSVVMETLKKHFVVEVTEKRVINEQEGYAGRCDAIGEWDKVRSIIDYKTSSSSTINNKDRLRDYWKQLAAYAIPNDIKQGVLVLFTPDLKKPKDPIICDNLEPYYAMFIADLKKFKRTYKLN